MRDAVKFIMHFVRHLIISVEMLVYLVAYTVYATCPKVHEVFLGATTETDYVLFVISFLGLLCGYVVYQVRGIMWPDEENKVVLLRWPSYLQVKACCIAAVVHGAMPVFVTILLVLLPNILPHGTKAYLYLTFIAVVAVDALSCLLAPIALSQILSEDREGVKIK